MEMQVKRSAEERVQAQTTELTHSWSYQRGQVRANQSSDPKPPLQMVVLSSMGHENFSPFYLEQINGGNISLEDAIYAFLSRHAAPQSIQARGAARRDMIQ